MTLKEKFAYMATGKPYNDLDPLLIEARNKATEDTNKLNAENDPAKKEELIRKLFGSAGKTPFVNPNFRCEFGQNIHVGDNFYANYDCVILDGAPVTMFCLHQKLVCTLAITFLMLSRESLGDALLSRSGLVIAAG